MTRAFRSLVEGTLLDRDKGSQVMEDGVLISSFYFKLYKRTHYLCYMQSLTEEIDIHIDCVGPLR